MLVTKSTVLFMSVNVGFYFEHDHSIISKFCRDNSNNLVPRSIDFKKLIVV